MIPHLTNATRQGFIFTGATADAKFSLFFFFLNSAATRFSQKSNNPFNLWMHSTKWIPHRLSASWRRGALTGACFHLHAAALWIAACSVLSFRHLALASADVWTPEKSLLRWRAARSVTVGSALRTAWLLKLVCLHLCDMVCCTHNTPAVYSILNETDSAATKWRFHAFVVLAVYSREFESGLKESQTHFQ